jgi:hypothetical protein
VPAERARPTPAPADAWPLPDGDLPPCSARIHGDYARDGSVVDASFNAGRTHASQNAASMMMMERPAMSAPQNQ